MIDSLHKNLLHQMSQAWDIISDCNDILHSTEEILRLHCKKNIAQRNAVLIKILEMRRKIDEYLVNHG